MAAIKFTDATKAYPRTIAPAGKYPIVGDRIYATLKDAQDYVDGNSSSKSAIPGITLSVISDGENNGAYWVAQAAGYENATKGILIKYSQGGETSSTLAGLLDVQVSSPSNGQALVYDSASGMWMNKSIISALGYTPFDSDAFTKANIKNALGIKDWALASSKPSYTFAEITSKPTTLSGYGITNAILYEGAIDLSSAYRSMGYGHASKGWRTSGPAVVFGDTSYNLAMQCAIANADYVSLYVRNKYNGVEYGWDRIVTEGLLSRGAIAFDTQYYKCLGDIVIHRNSESGDTYLNYGVANTDKANLKVYGYNISFYAGEASSHTTYLQLYNDGTATFFVPLKGTSMALTGNADAKQYLCNGTVVLNQISNNLLVNYDNRKTGELYLLGSSIKLSVDGADTFPLQVRADGAVVIGNVALTSGTGSSLKGYAYEAQYYYSDGKIMLHRNTGQEGTRLNYGGRDESLYIYGNAFYFYFTGYNSAFLIDQDNGAKFSTNLTVAGEISAKNYMIGQYLPSAPLDSFATAIFGKSDSDVCKMRLQQCTVAIEDVGVQYSPVLAVKTFSTHGFISFGYNSANKDKCYIGAGNGDAVNWSGILFHNNMNLIPKTDNTYTLGDSSYRWKEVNAVSIKIGDATLTWDASAGMLKIDKGVYSEGAITAKKKA